MNALDSLFKFKIGRIVITEKAAGRYWIAGRSYHEKPDGSRILVYHLESTNKPPTPLPGVVYNSDIAVYEEDIECSGPS